MSQYVAVAPESVLPDIKRHLLLFDKVAIFHSRDDDWAFREKNPTLAADLDWLEGKGLILRVDEFLNQEMGVEFARGNKDEGRHGVVITPTTPQIHNIRELKGDLLGVPLLKKFDGKTVRDLLAGINDVGCRWEAQRLASLMSVRAVSLSPPPSRSQRTPGGQDDAGERAKNST